MADVVAKTAPKGRPEPTFVVDTAYIKREAREAAITFLAPFSGIYQALRRED